MANGDGGVKLFMTGGDLSALLVDLAGLDFGGALVSALGLPKRTPVRCMIVDMPLQRGVLDTRMMLLDTEEANITGKGTVDLRNETIDYRIDQQSKHFTIGALPAPIHIRGRLKSPSIMPDPAAVGLRGGIAAALGVLAHPARRAAADHPARPRRGQRLRQADRRGRALGEQQAEPRTGAQPHTPLTSVRPRRRGLASGPSLREEADLYHAPTLTDLTQLLGRCASGDAEAFRHLYDLQAARLYGIALRVVRHPSLAADVLHDSFVSAWQFAGSFDPARGSAEAWLTSIVRHRALDLVRRRGREIADADLAEQADEDPDPLARLAGSPEGIPLNRCLEALDEDQRGLIGMAFIHGYSHADLGAKTRHPPRGGEVVRPARPGGPPAVPRAMNEASQDRDLLAGAYVLGALEPDEAHAVVALAEQDQAVADLIEAWRNRLAPLADAATPVPPPAAVWQRLEASLGLPPAVAPQLAAAAVAEQPRLALRLWSDLRFWRLMTAARPRLGGRLGRGRLSRPVRRPRIRGGARPARRPASRLHREPRAGRRAPVAPARARRRAAGQGSGAMGARRGRAEAGVARRAALDRAAAYAARDAAVRDAADGQSRTPWRLAHGLPDRAGAYAGTLARLD